MHEIEAKREKLCNEFRTFTEADRSNSNAHAQVYMYGVRKWTNLITASSFGILDLAAY